MDSYFSCLNGISKSAQVLLNCMAAVMVLSLIILKQVCILVLRPETTGIPHFYVGHGQKLFNRRRV